MLIDLEGREGGIQRDPGAIINMVGGGWAYRERWNSYINRSDLNYSYLGRCTEWISSRYHVFLSLALRRQVCVKFTEMSIVFQVSPFSAAHPAGEERCSPKLGHALLAQILSRRRPVQYGYQGSSCVSQLENVFFQHFPEKAWLVVFTVQSHAGACVMCTVYASGWCSIVCRCSPFGAIQISD